MSKWKCEICGKEFDNFHAQGFDNKIYCPLCYFKKENQELKNQQKEFIEYLEDKLNRCDGFLDSIKSDLKEIPYTGRISGKNYIATQIMKNETAKKNYEEILSKYKEIIGGDNK